MEKNKKQMTEMIVLAVLVIVLIGVTVKAVMKIKGSFAKINMAKTVAPITPATGDQIAMPVQGPAVAQGQATGQSAWGVDPFSGRQIYIAQENTTELKLSGIVYTPGKPASSYAIINNSIVSIGDTLENTKLKVKNILKEEVILIDGTKEIKLNVW